MPGDKHCDCDKSSNSLSSENKNILSELVFEMSSQLPGVTGKQIKKKGRVVRLNGDFSEQELKELKLVQETKGSTPFLTGFSGSYRKNDTTRQISKPLAMAVTALFNKRMSTKFRNDKHNAVESGKTQYIHNFLQDLPSIIDELSHFFNEDSLNNVKNISSIDVSHSGMTGSESESCLACVSFFACMIECN